jgi:hypothetical protein
MRGDMKHLKNAFFYDYAEKVGVGMAKFKKNDKRRE